jgi:putative methyltransferase (TIGR04325 family)
MTVDIRRLVKRWVPPVLVDWYYSVRNRERHQGHIWEGIYQNYRDVPVSGEGFDSAYWITGMRAGTEAVLREDSSGAGEYALLPFLASLVSSKQDRLTILDFGGGMGAEYVYLIRSLPQGLPLQYYVVEGRKVCEAGTELFSGDNRIRFCVSLPKDLPHVDIVYLRSALQYIEDYRGLLRQLAGLRPQFILFVDLVAGENPTYATAQRNVPGSVIPYWFFHGREICTLMAGLEYELIFQGLQERHYDQSNFPETHRLGHARNLLFARQPAVVGES